MVTDTENGCSESSEVEVLEDIDPPTVMIDNTGPLNFDCNTSTLVLDASASAPFGNLSLSWTSTDGTILSDEDTPNPEIGAAGTDDGFRMAVVDNEKSTVVLPRKIV